MKKTFVVLLLAASALATAPFASADFTHTISYAYAQKTSLKITDPKGFKVSVVVDGQTKEDTVPTIVSLPDADAFLPVTITSTDGKSWTGKIEVKAHNQTTLNFAYTAAAAPQGATARKFIGKVVNLTNTCDAAHQGDMHFEFLDANGTKAYETDVVMNTYTPNVELAQGSYDVRIYKKTKTGPLYQSTSKYTVEKDGWAFEWTCKR